MRFVRLSAVSFTLPITILSSVGPIPEVPPLISIETAPSAGAPPVVGSGLPWPSVIVR
jgi:hypothetical protein